MVTKIWISQVILTFVSGVISIELLPEKYLKPQDFNHHPFTDVGIPASLKKASITNPYAILSKKRPREGREFPPQNVIIYPTPHPSVISRKHVETNEIDKYDDPYSNVPKNYAFSYIVKDQHSGDDFSHSQAHNGKATRGQYRVKLPDGRTQIVSYTADHKGYRADVQYENDFVGKPKSVFHAVQKVPAVNFPEILPGYQKPGFLSKEIIPVDTNLSNKVVYAVTAGPANYLQSATTAAPVRYIPENTAAQLVVKSTAAPQYYHPQYVSTTVAPYVQQQYTAAPLHYSPHHFSSTPLYPVAHAPTAVAPSAYHRNQYDNYQVSSTVTPQPTVIVTPRPAYNIPDAKHEQQQSTPVLFRLLK